MLSSNLREDLARLFDREGGGGGGEEVVNISFVGTHGLTAVVLRSYAPLGQHQETRPLARTDFLNLVNVLMARTS